MLSVIQHLVLNNLVFGSSLPVFEMAFFMKIMNSLRSNGKYVRPDSLCITYHNHQQKRCQMCHQNQLADVSNISKMSLVLVLSSLLSRFFRVVVKDVIYYKYPFPENDGSDFKLKNAKVRTFLNLIKQATSD